MKVIVFLAILFVAIVVFVFAGLPESAEPSRQLAPKSTANTELSPPTTPPSPSLPPSPKYNWEVVDLTYKIIEKNPIWWKFSWQAMIKNNTNSVVEFFITVNFLDNDGFIIEDDTENPTDFRPLEQRIIKGYSLIDTEIASDVKSIELGDVSAYTRK